MIIRELYDSFLVVPNKLSYNRHHIYGFDIGVTVHHIYK